MKRILAFIIIIVLGWLFTSFGPWYLIALAGLLGGLLIRNGWGGFLMGFAAGFLLWIVQIWLLKDASPSDLPNRMGELIGVGSATALMLISSALGGLVTACGAAAGGVLFQKTDKDKRGKRSQRFRRGRKQYR